MTPQLKKTKRQSVAPAVLSYMTGNPDRPVPLTEIAEAIGRQVSSVNGALNRMMQEYPQCRRPQKGVYLWDSTAKAKESAEYLVKVLSRKDDGTMLVQDEDGEQVYVMKPVEY